MSLMGELIENVTRTMVRWGQAIQVAQRQDWCRRTGLPWRQFDEYAAAAARTRVEHSLGPLAHVLDVRPPPPPAIPPELCLGDMVDLVGPPETVVWAGPKLAVLRPDGSSVEIRGDSRGLTRGEIRKACADGTPRYLLRGKEPGAPWRLVAE